MEKSTGTPPDEHWIAAIKENPEKFPTLGTLVYLNDIHHDRRLKQAEYDRALFTPGLLFLAAGLYGFHVAGKYPFTQRKLSRRDLLRTSALGTGEILLGKLADIFSTREGVLQFNRNVHVIKEHPVFQNLPSGVQQSILPPVGAFESNPKFDQIVETEQNVPIALSHSGRETVKEAAKMGGYALLAKAIAQGVNKLKKSNSPHGNKPIGRRFFLGGSLGLLATALHTAGNNVSIKEEIESHPKKVIAELRELHKIMEKRTGKGR